MKLVRLIGLFLVFAIFIGCGSGGDDDDDDQGVVPDDDDSDDDTTPDDDDSPTDDDSDDDDTTDDDDDDNDDSDDDDDDDDDNDVFSDDDDDFAACASYGLPQIDGALDSDQLTEASGLAVSFANPGVIWTHNDSGDGPILYSFDLAGNFLGTVTLTAGATAIDWEDMAAGPCGADECLYVGDFGDNGGSRTDCAVYRFVEPAVDPLIPFGNLDVDTWEKFEFTYPDGPRDAESLGIHPDERVFVFSKYPTGTSEMYEFPVLDPDDPVVLTYIGDLESGGAAAVTTAADIHRNGRRLIFRTYLTAIEWGLATGEPFENILGAARRVVPVGLEIQGEAIAYDPATGNYLHAAEGSTPSLFRIPCM